MPHEDTSGAVPAPCSIAAASFRATRRRPDDIAPCVIAGAIGRVRIASTRYVQAAGTFTRPSGDNFAIHVL